MLVVGECLVDELHLADGGVRRYLGGSPANVAVALARLQRPVDLWTCLGDDPDGHWLADQLTTAGVRLVGDPFAARATSVARGTLDAAGVARWEFAMHWTPRGEPAFDEIAAVHVGSLGAVLAPGADRVAAVLATVPPWCLRSYDVNARPTASGDGAEVRERVEQWLAWTDVARASTEDLAALWPHLEPRQVVQHWFGSASRPGTAVVTDGPRGLHRISRYSREVYRPPASWPVVDTVGAGDAVSAAVIDTVLRYRGEMENWGRVAARAARAGELSVTRAGAVPPTLDELDGPTLP